MTENPLKIVSETSSRASANSPVKKNLRQETQAKFERLWLINPEQFNPLRNCMERERLDRSWNLLKSHIDPAEKKTADIGCGSGVFSLRLAKAGAIVDAIDIASNALKSIPENELKIQRIQDFMPRTKLPDDAYDLVIAMELIAYLPSQEYRLFMSELSRLVNSSGCLICSTAVDIDSEDALSRFVELLETEFKIEKSHVSYHRLSIRIWNFFEAPARFIRANRESEFYQQELSKRKGLEKWWFKWNSCKIPAYFWSVIALFSNPILNFLKQNSFVLNKLETICRWGWDESGISHVICVCSRRSLIINTPVENQPREIKHKKEVWE